MVFCCCHWLKFFVFCLENCHDFSQILWRRSVNIFRGLQRIPTVRETGNNWFRFFQSAGFDYWVLFENDIQTIRTFLISRQMWTMLWWVVLAPRNSIDIFVEVGGVDIARHLLKGQQNFVCFKCRRGVLTSDFWLTFGAHLLLFFWRSCSGSKCDFIVSTSHPAEVIENTFELLSPCRSGNPCQNLHSMALERPGFKIRITLGVSLISSLVSAKSVPGCLRRGSGVALS